MLIQDNNSKELDRGGIIASMSLAVNCGCLNDPLNRQGLAHFLEHMIFMGSSKFPDENTFSNLISMHGGYSNAYTDMELTNYQLRVDAKGLNQALEMLAYLLSEPLLKQDAQEREIEAIESEFETNYPYDSSRRFQLLCSNTSNKNHPLNRFTWGNLKSLTGHKSKEILKDLRKFFEDQYSADRMKLVIQMKTEDNMKTIKQYITETFSIIPNRKLEIQDFSFTKDKKQIPLPYEKNANEIIVFNSVKNSNVLYIYFTFKKEDQKKRTLAFYFISQILGHEGKGSLYQDLKHKELILKVDIFEDTQFKTLLNAFKISFTLTERGVQEYQQVIASLFRFINLIKDELSSLNSFQDFQFFNELKLTSELGFYYYKIPEPIDNVCEIANEMLFTQNIKTILKDTYSDQIVTDIDLGYVINILDQMNIEKCKIIISGKNILDKEQFKKNIIGKKPKIEKWFKTKYGVIKKNEKVLQQMIQDYDISNIFLPKKNPLIPQDFSIKSKLDLQKNKDPQLIKKQENNMEIWLHQDHVFKMPRSVIQILFIIPQFFHSPKRRAYFSVYTDALIEKVTAEIGYEAVLADISYSIKAFENIGFKLKFCGYNDKLIDFIKIFLQILYQTKENGFEDWLISLAIEKSLKSYKNLNVEVDQRTGNNRLIFLLSQQFHATLMVKELENFDIQDFRNDYVAKQILEEIQYVKVFIAGNMDENDGFQLGDNIMNILKIENKNANFQEQCKTQVRLILDNVTIEWDCVQGMNESSSKDNDSENESMEDLTEQDGIGSSDEEEDEDNNDDEEGKSESEEDNEEKKENNSCISIYFQAKKHDLQTAVELQLLEQILEDKFYDELRNKEQCGYYVAATRRNTRGIYGFLFTIESSKFDPLQLQEKIMNFINKTYDDLSKEPAKIKEFHDGLVARKKEGFKDIKEESAYLFDQMKDFSTTPQPIIWDKVEREIQSLEKDVSHERILQQYKEILIDNPKMAVFRVFAQKHKDLAKKTEVEELVTSGEYYKNKFEEAFDMYLNS